MSWPCWRRPDAREIGGAIVMHSSVSREQGPQELSDLRAREGWTQRELAKRLGVSHTTVSYWERHGLPRGRRGDIARVFGLNATQVRCLTAAAEVSGAGRESLVPLGQLELARLERDAARRAYDELADDLNTTIRELVDALEFYADYATYMIPDESRLRIVKAGYRRPILADGGCRARVALGEEGGGK
ncbi:helix-turn-helix domain-containing protein [Bradymonadaceae bacterium TMQ3]|nr:helix-turn-helix domain-containing protein [Bradymonadaceae bacterium TMQ3]TXC67610.1 helix-turn-helix transcriptional regulator [Bradymonadales bacterium TMQ1]